jgi:gamma-glutamyltranspeptidase/glutathione hydrolase
MPRQAPGSGTGVPASPWKLGGSIGAVKTFKPFAGLGLAILAACTTPQTPPRLNQPEAASPIRHQVGRTFARQAVAAAHPLAAEAGAQVLRDGGNAVDAAVAVQMVLTLVEPQSSGIGGGAFLLHWDGHRVTAWDGRETAPGAAGPALFQRPDGQALPMADAVASGLSVGVPGTVHMLEAAHRALGHLPWSRLLAPAIALAENGFPVGERLHLLLQGAQHLQADPAARAYFYQPVRAGEGLQPWPVGHRLRNPALAQVLRRLASEGSAALYQGGVAQAIVAKVRSHPLRPGRLAATDLSGYQSLRREPLCTDWRTWRVCGMPPPSSGHLTMMQMLGLLDARPDTGAAVDERAHHEIEAARLAFADRGRYVADPAFVAPPGGTWASLLDPGYLRERARLIGPRSNGVAAPGVPPGPATAAWGLPAPQLEHGTSHISIADAQGQGVSMTTTIEAAFGSGLLCDGGTGLPGGFLLNNELTDFALRATDEAGQAVANRVEPGKRPRSSMAPTLVFDRATGQLLASLGSPGGAAIIAFTAKTMLALSQGLSPQQAADLPNLVNLNTDATWIERGQWPAAVQAALRARGHRLIEDDLTSGIQVLQRAPQGGWVGGADPRREGAVAGD